MRRTGCAVDARLLSYAYGLEHAKEAAALVVAEAAARAAAAGARSSSIAVRQQGGQAAARGMQAVAAGAGGSTARAAPSSAAENEDGAAANDSAGEDEFEDASDVPLPFGSPVLSSAWLQGGSSRSSSVGQTAAAASRQGSGAAAAAAAGEPAGCVEAGSDHSSKQAVLAPAASSVTSQLGSLLQARSSWLLFAAGWAAGAAGCALLLSRSQHAHSF